MEEQRSVRVIVAEDHMILREGLQKLLEEGGGIKVVGEASNGIELLEKLKEVKADVILMDLNMPEMDGYTAAEHVRAEHPDTKVLVLSMLNNPAFVQKALACGASGYLLETVGKDELNSAIKLVANGGNYISGELSMNLFATPAAEDTINKKEINTYKLSNREIEILELISEGYTNAEIADKIFTSKRTVETHRQNILAKTGTRNTANLIKFALEHKIIGMEEGW